MSTPRLWQQRWFVPLVPTGLTAIALAASFTMCLGTPCWSTGVPYGLWLDDCPATNLRLEVRTTASGLHRGGSGTVEISPQARFLEGEGPNARLRSEPFGRGLSVAFELVDDADKPVEGWSSSYASGSATSQSYGISVPQLPDGDYRLKVTTSTRFDNAVTELDLPFYTPAIAFVTTDRPLYKPGQDVLLRSVLLARDDLTPLDGRPGKWRILSPSGEEFLVEKDKAGAFGVADTSFPLDTLADVGTWTAEYVSGPASDRITFEVRPFRMPRFTATVAPSKSWYKIGDRLIVEGMARYGSGAPLANADVEVQLFAQEGRWPMPLDWEPQKKLKTGPDGSFRVDWGVVPADLLERSVFTVQAQVTDQTGESGAAGGSVVLSQDPIRVEAVTELGDGLVGGFNNRAYLRVTTPDGQAVANTKISVTPAWDPTAAPKEAETDADGVASIQIDPGNPVTVVIPAPPFRPRPAAEAEQASLQSATEVSTYRSLDFEERRGFDNLVGAVTACGMYAYEGGSSVDLGVIIDRGGAVVDAIGGTDTLSQCVIAAHRGLRAGGGEPRVIQINWRVPANLHPSIDVSFSPAWGDYSDIEAAVTEASIAARRCLRPGQGFDGTEIIRGQWSVRAGQRAFRWLGVDGVPGSGLNADALACVRATFQGATALRGSMGAEAGYGDGIGSMTATLRVPEPPGQVRPQATTTTGYELAVVADLDGDTGKTRLILPVGNIPDLRLRATPSLAKAGDTVTVEFLRGPNYGGGVPDELWMSAGSKSYGKAVVDKQTNTASWKLPDDAEGFAQVEWGGARAVVFASPLKPLQVSLTTDNTKYRPGETAHLVVTTTAGGAPVPAGVGLSGVDVTLGQLAPLLQADAWGRVTVRTTSDRPAFGSFDPKALTLGQIRGENAAKAAILRIAQLPAIQSGEDYLSANGYAAPEDAVFKSDQFYRVLTVATEKVRAWEDGTAATERMTPEKMATLWQEALDELTAKGEPAVDAYGRTLSLKNLDESLLIQCDPRTLVRDATRLPEDIRSWTQFVASELL